MEKGFYHSSIGYWQTVSTVSEETLSQYPEGTIEVPLKPGIGYTYDGTKWIPPTQEWLYEAKAKVIREKRNFLLKQKLDKTVSNPIRWEEMSYEKKQEWINYRQALLDITKQEGFPFQVTWPDLPN